MTLIIIVTMSHSARYLRSWLSSVILCHTVQNLVHSIVGPRWIELQGMDTRPLGLSCGVWY